MNFGMPHFENMDAKRGPPVLAKNLMRNIGHRDQLAWKHVELIRKRWKGKLVVKGLVSPADARMARESGVDGVMLSNHGGRQLDYTMSGLRTLPEIAAEAKGMTIMVDGGIRRGTDVIKALGARRAFRLDRPSLPLCRDRRRRSRRAARDHAAQGRDRPRPRAAWDSLDQRDHAGPGAEVLEATVCPSCTEIASTESPPMRAWVRPPVAMTSPNTISSRRGASQIVISAVPKWLRT